MLVNLFGSNYNNWCLHIFIFQTLLATTTTISRGQPLQQVTQTWTDFIVPYVLSSSEDFSENERQILLGAMREISKRSCLRFKVRWSNEPNYLHFVKEDEHTNCRQLYPRLANTGEQKIGFSRHPSCLNHNGALHLILVSLGFSEEQTQRFILTDGSALNCNQFLYNNNPSN